MIDIMSMGLGAAVGVILGVLLYMLYKKFVT
jgi:ElaB/YqjD/DUF883 family membrane-anchored ribosome-binding protein